MADSLNLSTTPLFITADEDAEVKIVNGGPGTLYYKTTRDVSSASYDGTIADGASLQFRAPKWIVSTTNSKVFVEHTEGHQDAHRTHGNREINVLAYGAIGDGSADDTAAIQAAIDDAGAGDTVVFPNGVYRCGDLDPVVGVPGLTFRGEGARPDTTDAGTKTGTQITYTGGAGVWLDLGTFDSTPTSPWEGTSGGFTLEGIRIAKASGQTEGSRTGTAIRDNGNGDFTLRDAAISRFQYGFCAPYGSDFTIIDRCFINNNDVGVYLGKDSQQVDIRRTEFYFNMEAFVADSAPHGLIQNCWFIDSRTVDVQFERLTTSRLGLTEGGTELNDLAWTLSDCWHESGANGDNVKVSNGHIRTYTNDAETSYPRNVIVDRPYLVAGGSGGSNRSFWECATGKYLTLKNLRVRGDQIAYAMNRGSATKLYLENISTADGYTAVADFRNENSECRYRETHTMVEIGTGSSAYHEWREASADARIRWVVNDDKSVSLDFWTGSAWVSRMKFDPNNNTFTINDTQLKRLAADVMGTAAGDKFVANAGLGVGNSAAGSTPGTCVKKIEVFDASGSSLGYVPVYDAIT